MALTHERIRREYGKIIRDRIPEFIAAKGEHAEIATVDPAEARVLLLQKLTEEAAKAATANPEHLPEELADIEEVVRALADLTGVSLEQLESIRLKKFAERGGFTKRIKLIATN